MVARSVTVNQQVNRGVIGTPKGRTRRTIPMTTRLYETLKSIATVREGLLLPNSEGRPMTDSLVAAASYRICRKAAKLPERGWHILRHSFATHSAMFGINPWTLNAYLGHKTMEETMRYVHVAENHHRDIPDGIEQAGAGERDVTKRVLLMLSARGNVQIYGNLTAVESSSKEEEKQFSLVI